jgi:hypothetical protein
MMSAVEKLLTDRSLFTAYSNHESSGGVNAGRDEAQGTRLEAIGIRQQARGVILK